MKEHLKTEHIEARKEEFLNALLALMLQMPYEKIAVRDLCAKLDISRKTFYRYFSGKEEALYALVDSVLCNVGTYTPPVEVHSADPIEEEMIRYFYYWSENRYILQMLLDNSLIEVLFFRSVTIALSEMEIFQKKLQHLDAVARESVVAYYVGGLQSMLLYWMRHGCTESPEELAARLIRLAGIQQKG